MIKKMILSVVVLVAFIGNICAQDVIVASGKKIKMDYTLSVNGEELETSVGKTPLEFIAGDQSIIPGLEKGIEGMKVGEEKTIVVEAKDAYGEVDPKALKEFPKDKIPAIADLKVGMVLEAQSPDGEQFPATVAEIKGDKIVMDFNHPLAGKQLTFKIKILEITDAPAPGPELAKVPAEKNKE